MAEARKLAGFDIEEKLQAPSKKSLFEKQKADAEAKRLREAEETAAVYQDFIKSFEEEDGEGADAPTTIGAPGDIGTRGGIGRPPKRHFPPANPPSACIGGRGRGSAAGASRSGAYGSGIGSLGPPADTFSRKRTHDGFQASRREHDRGLLAFEDYEEPPTLKEAFRTSDDEDEKAQAGRAAERAVAKPTLQLSSLPPGTSPAAIKALLPPTLTVDAVRILTYHGSNTERKSVSAIVTLAKDTAGNDIDAAVNGLQNRYVGFGFYLSLHRHLSSAAISSASQLPGALHSTASSMPFGAKTVNLPSDGPPRHGPPGQRNFAPPSSYGPAATSLPRTGPLLHVPVQPPQNIKELKLIHKTIENLLTHGPEFEALLMSRPAVQREEKWAWLWDPRSTGGVWYRWRLYEILSGTSMRRGQGRYLPLFEGATAWKAPDAGLPFEYVTRIDQIVSDSDYDSSDDEESGDERGRRHHGAGPPAQAIVDATDDGRAYLNPLEKAKLTHLLARLPTSTAKLRKGDVARITAFAISHAGQGADEVVAAIIANIERPFAYTSANPERKREKDDDAATPGASDGLGVGAADAAPEDPEDAPGAGKEDMSSAKLIGLYVISDILSSSSTSGVRHAWRYRQLFEAGLRARRVFERLGRVEREMGWGRLRAEKWRRGVGSLLGLWEGWCVFPQESQEFFVAAFRDPPRLGREEKAVVEREKAREEAGPEEEAERAEAPETRRGEAKGKWKSVLEPDDAANASDATKRDGEGPEAVAPPAEEDLDGVAMDLDGEDIRDRDGDDEDMDGEPMEEEDDDDDDMDGEPMAEEEEEEEDDDDDEEPNHHPTLQPDSVPTSESQRQHDPTPRPAETSTSISKHAPGASLRDRIAAATAAAHAKAAAGVAESGAGSNGGGGATAAGRKRRLKAEDMFADSDEEG